MRTLDKYEPYSDEYCKEVQKENAYYISLIIGLIADGFNISRELKNKLWDLYSYAESEVGKEEFTIGL